jgi:hypothetical protein
MDGIRVDPKTALPDEGAKLSFLYAYGEDLKFRLRLDLQDISSADRDALFVLQHLLQDFAGGDIPLGGAKTNGLGWVHAKVDQLEWFTSQANGLTTQLFPDLPLSRSGIWQTLTVSGEAASKLWTPSTALSSEKVKNSAPPRAQGGFISHRAFGGYCGNLLVEAEILRPTHIKESGEPSYTSMVHAEQVSGWDFFSMSSPDNELRPEKRSYALPSRSLKGMLRHIYSIASDSKETGADLRRLNPADSLFGWVGTGQNQAIMGRLAFSFGVFENPQLAWFKVPYPYGKWKLVGGEWQSAADTRASKLLIDQTWRLFPHAPVAPLVKRLDDFAPDAVQASYFRAILPGARARFTLRFWNLDEQELQRLMWCVALEPNLAHKIGNNRYLGFGSLRLRVLPESFLVNWTNRYTGKPEADERTPIRAADWSKPGVVAHHPELLKALDAKRL